MLCCELGWQALEELQHRHEDVDAVPLLHLAVQCAQRHQVREALLRRSSGRSRAASRTRARVRGCAAAEVRGREVCGAEALAALEVAPDGDARVQDAEDVPDLLGSSNARVSVLGGSVSKK